MTTSSAYFFQWEQSCPSTSIWKDNGPWPWQHMNTPCFVIRPTARKCWYNESSVKPQETPYQQKWWSSWKNHSNTDLNVDQKKSIFVSGILLPQAWKDRLWWSTKFNPSGIYKQNFPSLGKQHHHTTSRLRGGARRATCETSCHFRMFVWWPDMVRELVKTVQSCYSCSDGLIKADSGCVQALFRLLTTEIVWCICKHEVYQWFLFCILLLYCGW